MRIIDMDTWPRKDHFNLFRAFNHPHFSMCANVDISKTLPYIKEHKHSFTIAIAYLIGRTANSIQEFRLRIRGDQVIEHEVVNPSFTILVSDDLFSFCNVDYVENFVLFEADALAIIESVKTNLDLDTEQEPDDRLFMSPIPWVSFTSFFHPMQFHPSDSVPRFAWGKYFEEGNQIRMPLQVQGHHALMDGLHVGRFYQQFQEFLIEPERILGP